MPSRGLSGSRARINQNRIGDLLGLRGFHARSNPNLPALLEGWEWHVRHGFYAACLFTFEYDCIVEIRDRILHLSTGVAPIEIVQAVLKANNL